MKNLRIFSIRKNKKNLLTILVVVCLVSVALSLSLGSVAVPLPKLLSALFGGGRDTLEGQILHLVRLPRTLGCVAAGMALAVSGAVIQSVLSNPLAAPNIIGVNSGAGLAVALSCALFPSAAYLSPVFAFLGALLGVLTVLMIAEKNGASKMTLVLSGVAVSSIFSALIDAAVTFAPDALNGYSDFRIGGLANLSMARITPSLYIILPSFFILLILSPELDILALGTDTAKSLGLPAKRLRITALALAAALAGAAVSFAGLLGFVGLIVPHIIRGLIGEESAPLLLGSALGGAALLCLCDTLSRIVFAPYELPVGIVLSLIGGPFFLWLLLRQRGGRIRD